MGKVNIEYINSNQVGEAAVSMKGQNFFIDITPISFADSSFEVISTTSTSNTDAAAAPSDTTHALITSVASSHYVRLTTAPGETTGGICVMAGASRLIVVPVGGVLKIVTTE